MTLMTIPWFPIQPSIATNFEEDKQSEAADLNADNALMRAEFLEALIRVTIAKFLEKRTEGPSKPTTAPPKKGGGKVMDEAAAVAAAANEEAAQGLRERMEGLGECQTLEDACRRLLDHFLIPWVPPEAKVRIFVLIIT